MVVVELLGIAGQTWMADALCARTDPEVFYPEIGETDHVAKTSGRCPVVEQCRAYALETNEQHGVWGGLSEHERRRQRAGLAPAPATGCPRCGDEVTNRRARYCDACRAERQPPRRPSGCGTRAGYVAHKRHGIPVCDDCATAMRAYARERYHRRTKAA